MLTFNAFLFLITLCIAKSELDFATKCKNDYRNEDNNPIDVSQYCSGKLCIEKCCAPDEIMNTGSKCFKKKVFFESVVPKYGLYLKDQYESFDLLSSLHVNKAARKKTVFLQNKRNSAYLTNCTVDRNDLNEINISEDGSTRIPETSESKNMITLKRLNYCVDINVKQVGKELKVTTVFRQITEDPTELYKIRTFENIALMISSVFLLLVLIVYCLLPDLRNLTGLILMAYTLTLLVAFITKLILFFLLVQPNPSKNVCSILSPIVYFAFVSSIFWLSVYAFDVWWGLRGFRIKRKSKHGDLLKFMWYALFAWGTPLLFTSIIVVLDNLPDLNLTVPTPFHSCLRDGPSFDYYYRIPIGILIGINIVLFCMTVYNIWLVKRAVNRCHDSGRSKQQSNKFTTYAKLFLMMGVSWCLELLPYNDILWLYIILNLYNLLTGVIIFYMFVCKKIILLQLCKKFNISNNYIKSLEAERTQKHTDSGITRSTGCSSTVRRSKDQAQDIDPFQNYSKEENTIL